MNHPTVSLLRQPINPTGVGAILQIFRDGQARTKSDLTRITGLARSTVSARVETMLATGLLKPAGEASSSGGRPPAQVVFNPLAKLVIAVDLGATHGLVALCDLRGRVIQSQRAEISIADGPHNTLDWVITTAHAILAKVERPLSRVVGVGIGVPGPVEHSTGQPANPPIMPGWDRFDIPGYVTERLCGPVLVDNDVNVLALGERATVWPEINDLFFVKVSTGIGAGIISGGALQRGAQGAAGDIGHVQVPRGSDTSRADTDQRDLEAIAGGTALADMISSPEDRLSGSADVVTRLQLGDPKAIDTVRQAGRELGEVLATVVNLLNPAVIVLGGSIGNTGEHLIAGIRETVYRRSIPLATQHLTIVQSRSGEFGGAIGAAHMVIEHALDAGEIDRMLARG